DILLLHLTTPVPSTVATPMPVITSVNDNLSGGGFAHRTLGDEFYFRSTIPLPWIVGWGKPQCGEWVVRRSGQAQFESLGQYHHNCSPFADCNSNSPRTDLGCSWTQLDGQTPTNSDWYQTDGIAIARTSSAPGVWDGPVPSNGDSGSPLVLRYPDPSGNTTN